MLRGCPKAKLWIQEHLNFRSSLCFATYPVSTVGETEPLGSDHALNCGRVWIWIQIFWLRSIFSHQSCSQFDSDPKVVVIWSLNEFKFLVEHGTRRLKSALVIHVVTNGMP